MFPMPATISPFYNLGTSGLGDLPLVALCLGVPASVRNERPEYPAGTR
jgi:hypothetical protein